MTRQSVEEKTIWLQRWHDRRLAFHLEAPHPLLRRHISALSQRRRVLVPLCGKAPCMLFLQQQKLQVVGVELSAIAVREFFAENQLPIESQTNDTWCSRGGEISIYRGDYFDYYRADFDAFYDRAALIALPQPVRQRYLAHTALRLQRGAVGLLISLEYPQQCGPPFSINVDMVEKECSCYFQVEHLGSERTDNVPVGTGTEHIFSLRRK